MTLVTIPSPRCQGRLQPRLRAAPTQTAAQRARQMADFRSRYAGKHLTLGLEHWRMRDELYDILECRLKHQIVIAKLLCRLTAIARTRPRWCQVYLSIASKPWADFRTTHWQRVYAALRVVQRWLQMWPQPEAGDRR